ncbi:hypothetical protein M407DRAFT_59578, partial [Tulasnella calospora MUT 4182]
IPPSTLDARVNGRRSMADYSKQRRLLTEQEDIVLAEHVKMSGERAFPLSCAQIRARAETLVKARNPLAEIGKQWTYRWLQSHPELHIYTSSPLDQARADGMNKNALELYWKALEKVFHHLRPVDDPVEAQFIFGMDETGIMLGVGGKQKVVGASGQKIQHMKRDGNRELVTVMVTICADGTKLKEWITLKGKNFQERWLERNTNNIRMTCTESGYANNKLGLPWMKDFHQQTIDKSHRRRSLLLDGHASHCTPEALDFAKSVNIDVVSYPPHTTHETQGLDKVGFGALKKILAKLRGEWERTHGKVTKETFVVLYEKAAALAVTEKTVKACFSSTGVWPFDPA